MMLIKLPLGIIWSLAMLALALVPEWLMYLIWGNLNPTSVIEKVAVGAVFWFIGAALCLGFAALGFAFWIFGLKVLQES